MEKSKNEKYTATQFFPVKSTLQWFTVWKNTQNRYHAEKFSVKPHNINMSNLLLQILNFLPLGSNTGQCRLNIFQRLEHILQFRVKNISLNSKHIQRYHLLKIGQLLMLIIIFYIKPYQVFQHIMVLQTFLYQHEVRNLARICAKNHYFNFRMTNLLSKMSI